MPKKKQKPDNYVVNIRIKPQRLERGPEVQLKGEIDLPMGRLLWLLITVGCRTRASARAAVNLLRALEDGVPDDMALAREGRVDP